MEITVQSVVFVLGVVVLTAIAAATDLRFRRIPNKLTVPAFVAGLVYQAAFHGLSGLADAGLAFAIGFGTLFVLWLIGGGGGGDVKLMGALSTWLGMKLTLYVLVLSTLFVLFGTMAVILLSVFKRGFRGTKQQYVATGRTDEHGKPVYSETEQQRRQRRIMAYAIPVALATWVVMYLDVVAISGGQLGR